MEAPLSLWWPVLPPLPYSTVSRLSVACGLSLTDRGCFPTLLSFGSSFLFFSFLFLICICIISSSVRSRTPPMTCCAHSTVNGTRCSVCIAPLSAFMSFSHEPIEDTTSQCQAPWAVWLIGCAYWSAESDRLGYCISKPIVSPACCGRV